MLRKLCLPFSPYRQRPDITIHGPGVPRTGIPAHLPSGVLPQVRRGRQAATNPVSGELTGCPGDFEHPAVRSGSRLAETSPGCYRTHAPDKLPSARSSHESPIRLIPCLTSPGTTVARPAAVDFDSVRRTFTKSLGCFGVIVNLYQFRHQPAARSRHRHSAGITVTGRVG